MTNFDRLYTILINEGKANPADKKGSKGKNAKFQKHRNKWESRVSSKASRRRGKAESIEEGYFNISSGEDTPPSSSNSREQKVYFELYVKLLSDLENIQKQFQNLSLSRELSNDDKSFLQDLVIPGIDDCIIAGESYPGNDPYNYLIYLIEGLIEALHESEYDSLRVFGMVIETLQGLIDEPFKP